MLYSQRIRKGIAVRRNNMPEPTLMINNRKRKIKQMLYLRFAPKSMNTERKPQGIDHLMGCLFVCKYETGKIEVRHDIS